LTLFSYPRIAFQLLFLMMAVVFVVPSAHAEDKIWTVLDTEKDIFRVKFPTDHTLYSEVFKVDADHVAYTGEALATVKGANSKSDVVYKLKIDQTLGNKIEDWHLGNLIRKELQYYIEYYKKMGGVVSNLNEELHFGDFPGGSVQIAFEDPEKGPQSFKIRVLFTDVTKFQQIVIGPATAMDSYTTREYFDSLDLYNGYKIAKVTDQSTWIDYISPMKIFKITLPEKATVFMPTVPEIINRNKTERIAMQFADPLRNEKILMNIDGYIINKPTSYDIVLQLLDARYFQKHGITRNKYTCKQILIDKKLSYVECSTPIKPPRGYEYINSLFIRAHFINHDVMVQEVMSSQEFITTPFVKRLVDDSVFLMAPLNNTEDAEKTSVIVP
jgi:hypothetical protein